MARMTKGRAGVLVLALSGLGLVSACGGGGPPRPRLSTARACTPHPYTHLHTRPDLDGAPGACVMSTTPQAKEGGYIFLTPGGRSPTGPAIFDSAGHLVWFQPAPRGTDVHDLKVVEYRGQELLAWWEGRVTAGQGEGTYHLYDRHYHLVRTVTGGGGEPVDLHELVITPGGDALVDQYVPVKMDLTKEGGAPDTTVYDGVLQEIDLATGKVVFSWSSLDHVGLDESVVKPPTKPGQAYDYFHINSIALDRSDGDFVISARNTSSLYEIDPRTGAVVWRLCGTKAAACPQPRLRLEPASESFWFQHDPRPDHAGTLSFFDDGGGPPFHHDARGMVVRIDVKAGTARVVRTYGASLGVRVAFAGSMQPLASGGWLVGWGSVPRLTELSTSGKVILDMAFTGNSYRARRSSWEGSPSGPPAVAAQARPNGTTTVWASWNGATQVSRWRVLAGPDAHSLKAVGTFAWSDFETAMDVRTKDHTVAVEALGSHDRVLATSPAVAVAAAGH